jgi:anti-sigma regulatory factor (Ser/Thr protein kinase)
MPLGPKPATVVEVSYPTTVQRNGPNADARGETNQPPTRTINRVEESHGEFDGAPSSVALARRFANAVLEAGGATDDAWPVTQVVSELVTNAVVHAGTPFVLSISHDALHIRVAVTDGRPLARASMRRLSYETTTGRGLRMVQTLGQAWGVDQTDAAKTVWCELVRGA